MPSLSLHLVPVPNRNPAAEVFLLAFDVFISYATKDKIVADAVCARLESAGIRCWIAPRDILPGTSYGEAIIDAIHGAKAMILVFSSSANASAHIPKEVERAVSRGLTIIPFRIEDVAPGKSLDYFIGSVHWLDAMTPPMEKHVDELAATVHKLFPDKTVAPGPPPPIPRQYTQPAVASQTPAASYSPSAAMQSAASGRENVSAASSKAIWIGAAVAILAAVVTAVTLLRSGGNSPNPAPTPTPAPGPISTNPSGDNSGSTTVEKRTSNLPHSLKATADPIVGCYHWFNNGPVTIHSDGSMMGGPFPGHWRLVNASPRVYTFTWPEPVDTVTVSADQRTLNGSDSYGFPTTGARLSGTGGLVGAWRWTNGVTVVVESNGTFGVGSLRGKWRATDDGAGNYIMTWPNVVDTVTLSADGARLAGANQYGTAVSGYKTQPCTAN
jgi:TIR domain